jgi:hypothetical protein
MVTGGGGGGLGKRSLLAQPASPATKNTNNARFGDAIGLLFMAPRI